MNARIPAPDWVRRYQRGWLRGDLLAGVTVTAYLIPQVMAYAELAGLPAVAGLWAAIGALLVYAVLGSSRQLSVGPESTTALMTAAALGSVATSTASPTALAAALAFVVAGFCLLGWVGRLAALADLLSRPVLVGYLSGIAVIMVVSQLGKLPRHRGRTATASSQELSYAVRHVGEAHVPTLVLGLVTLVAMLLAALKFPRAPIALFGMLGCHARGVGPRPRGPGSAARGRDPRRRTHSRAAATSASTTWQRSCGRRSAWRSSDTPTTS